MASGYSVHGGESRCYSFWLAFKRCMLESSDKSVCSSYRQDYEECLHHRKAIKRFNEVVREYQRRQANGEELPLPGQMPTAPVDAHETGSAGSAPKGSDGSTAPEIPPEVVTP
jgi:NADH dehydrogenase (ubiquinone) Fe-S protein 5